MVISKAEKKLKRVLLSDYLFKSNNDDNYILTRQIAKVFPEIPSRLIIKTINRCFSLIDTRISKNDFVRIFLDQLFLTLEKDLEV
ncbi:MAG: hypothetical protein KJ571_09190 [Bacteroidetes bacterium]|nr:hypothetical protein [Bacteroidota bacterium]